MVNIYAAKNMVFKIRVLKKSFQKESFKKVLKDDYEKKSR